MQWELSKNKKSWFIFLSEHEKLSKVLPAQIPRIVSAIADQKSVVILPQIKWKSDKLDTRYDIVRTLRENGKPMLTGQIFKKLPYAYAAIKIELENLTNEEIIFRKAIPGKIGRGFRYSLDKNFGKKPKLSLKSLEGADEVNETNEESE